MVREITRFVMEASLETQTVMNFTRNGGRNKVGRERGSGGSGTTAGAQWLELDGGGHCKLAQAMSYGVPDHGGIHALMLAPL